MLERNEDGLDINELRATGYDFQMDDYEFDGTYPGIMYYGETVLSFAAIAGHTPIVKFLLESGANPGIADAYGNPMLPYHSIAKHQIKFSPLFASILCPGNNTLHMLCYYGLFEEDKGSIYDESPYKAITRFLRKKEKSGDLDPFLVNLNFGLDDTDDETSSSSKKKSSLDRAKSVKSSAVLENTLSGKSTGLGPRRKSIQRMVPPSMARNRKGFTPFLLAVDRGHVKVLDTHKEVIWDVRYFVYSREMVF